MSPIRSGAPRIVDIFANGRGEQRHGARQRAPCERRSEARPNFIEGWRKPLDPGFAPISQALPPCVNNRIEIWVASTDGLLRAKSCLQLLTDKDWESLVRIQDPANRNSAISARVLLRLGLSRATDRRIAPRNGTSQSTGSSGLSSQTVYLTFTTAYLTLTNSPRSRFLRTSTSELTSKAPTKT